MKSGGYKVCVSREGLQHNHAVGEQIYKHYPESRRLTHAALLDKVDSMARSGAKARGIQIYLREFTGTFGL